MPIFDHTLVVKRGVPLPLLAIGHGLNDFIAGYLLAQLLQLHLSLPEKSACFLLYNGLAFGGQYFVALWLKNGLQHRQAYLLTWALNFLALFFFIHSPALALIFAGTASALYHVTGGALASRGNKAFPIGLFAAPGIIGLVISGFAAAKGIEVWVYLKLITLLFFVAGFLFSFSVADTNEKASMPSLHFDKHDGLMVLLLTVITTRSAIWNIIQLVNQHNFSWLLWIGVSAFAGKIAGGWIADKIGWRLYTLVSLSLAAPLVHFFRHDLFLFCVGVALLQSGIPANTVLLLQYTQSREKGIAFSFGTTVLIAGFFSTLLWQLNLAAVSVIGWWTAALILIWCLGQVVFSRKLLLFAPPKRLKFKTR